MLGDCNYDDSMCLLKHCPDEAELYTACVTADKATAADAAEEKKLFSIDNIQMYILIAVAVVVPLLCLLVLLRHFFHPHRDRVKRLSMGEEPEEETGAAHHQARRTSRITAHNEMFHSHHGEGGKLNTIKHDPLHLHYHPGHGDGLFAEDHTGRHVGDPDFVPRGGEVIGWGHQEGDPHHHDLLRKTEKRGSVAAEHQVTIDYGGCN
jgi:hypothetical protein